MRRTAILMTAAVLALAPVAVAARGLTADAVAVLLTGKPWVAVNVDPGGDGALIQAAIDIPAPAEKVWRTMTDCRNAMKMITSLTSCKVLQQGPGWDIREQITRGGPLLPTIRNVYRSDYEPYRRIRFQRVDGDLKTMKGEWGLLPLNGGKGTRVTYENHMSVRILAPPPLVRAGLRKDTPKVLENLRRLVAGG